MSHSTLSATTTTTPLPPLGMTGAEITPPAQTPVLVHVDWLSVTLQGTDPADLMALFQEYLSGDFVDAAHGRYGYDRMRVGPAGAAVMWSTTRLDMGVHADLPGRWCSSLHWREMGDLLLRLLARGASFTRLDLAADDWEMRAQPVDIWEAIERGEMVTHAQSVKATVERNPHSGEQLGSGLTVGSRGSRVFLRIYDKSVESAGEIEAIRWELELRAEAAQQTVGLLLAQSEWGEVFSTLLVRFVDFREPAGENVTRRVRAAWFAALVGDCQKAAGYVQKVVRTLEQVATWLERQVAPSLAVLHAAAADPAGTIAGLLERGRLRWRPNHLALLGA